MRKRANRLLPLAFPFFFHYHLTMKQKLLYSLLILLLAFLVKFAFVKLPVLDDAGERYFSTSIKKAAVTYAVVRGVNAAVSVVKNSSVGISLGGKVTISAGEILDPIDDATERLSSLRTLSIISLEVLKILYEIAVLLTPVLLFWVILFLLIPLWVGNFKESLIVRFLFVSLILIVAARIVLPVTGIVNQYLTDKFFQPRIENNKRFLSRIVGGVQISDNPSVVGDTVYLAKRTKFLIGFLWKEKGKIVSAMVNIGILYGGILFIQVFLFPLLFFWAGYKSLEYFLSPYFLVSRRS